MTKNEDDQKLRRPKTKTTKNEDDQKRRRPKRILTKKITLKCLLRETQVATGVPRLVIVAL